MRGAPAIAIVGLLSIAVDIKNHVFPDRASFVKYLHRNCDYLCTARPTAVNLKRECDRLLQFLCSNEMVVEPETSRVIEQVTRYIHSLLSEDLSVNKSIGYHGAKHLLTTIGDRKLNILTHCNTGSLATSGYGTALGVVRSLQSLDRLDTIYCTETRPFNQGARLTAFEIVEEKMNGTLICDSMVAYLMAKKVIDAVIVGADRVVANGDTANKIGTYSIAVIAKHHQVPFYVASPISTIDTSLSDGSLIPIEERPASEMKSIAGAPTAPLEINCWNPAFDVTPSTLITGIMTEIGVTEPQRLLDLMTKEENDAN